MSTNRITLAAALSAGGLALALVPSGLAGATTSLGGFSISALAESSTATYDQPNAPIPATPTLELDEGYAATSDNFGPSGSATASSLYPGQVLANAGPELGSFVTGVPLPAAPVWPIQAQSGYPQTPNTASTDQPGVTMEATSAAAGNTATAQLGNAPTGSPAACAATAAGSSSGLPSLPASLPSLPTLPSLPDLSNGAGSPRSGLAASSAVAQIQSSSGTSSSGTAGTTATATATATDTCVSILGGLISVGSVTSTATATSNGTAAQLAGSTTVQNASIDGQSVTIDSTGIHAAGQSSPSNPVLATAEQALTQLGITMTVTNPTDTVKGSQASRTLDGLRVQINLTTLDKQAQSFSSLIPASITAELPVPVPNKQILVWDLGTVNVTVAASPAFKLTTTGAASTTTSASTAASSLAPASLGTGTAGTTGTSAYAGASAGTTGSGTYGTGGTSGSAGTSDAAPSGTTPAKGVAATDSSSSVPLAFKGIGAGLILLGLLAAGALAYASMRASSAAEALPGGGPCELGDGDAPIDAGGEN